jgi:hypothetical protein
VRTFSGDIDILRFRETLLHFAGGFAERRLCNFPRNPLYPAPYQILIAANFWTVAQSNSSVLPCIKHAQIAGS